jgi:hypothetical protein
MGTDYRGFDTLLQIELPLIPIEDLINNLLSFLVTHDGMDKISILEEYVGLLTCM